jgi:Txe/YoeB family toxin of Txe-Axe toxin-antitoxin module
MAVMTSETFFASMAKLEAKEAAKTIEFVNRFMANPANPGISLERLNSNNKRLWSGRITQELRAILYQDGEHWALLHAGHHDAAYRWAERRTIDKHPVTGILQIVETVEAAGDVQRTVPDTKPGDARLFKEHEDD